MTTTGTKLLDATTTDGASGALTVSRGAVAFAVAGTFDGASVALQLSFDGVEWFDVTSLSAKDVILIDTPAAMLRASVSGAGASTSVTAWIG